MDNLQQLYLVQLATANEMALQGDFRGCLNVCYELRLKPDLALYTRAMVCLTICGLVTFNELPTKLDIAFDALRVATELQEQDHHTRDVFWNGEIDRLVEEASQAVDDARDEEHAHIRATFPNLFLEPGEEPFVDARGALDIQRSSNLDFNTDITDDNRTIDTGETQTRRQEAGEMLEECEMDDDHDHDHGNDDLSTDSGTMWAVEGKLTLHPADHAELALAPTYEPILTSVTQLSEQAISFPEPESELDTQASSVPSSSSNDTISSLTSLPRVSHLFDESTTFETPPTSTDLMSEKE